MKMTITFSWWTSEGREEPPMEHVEPLKEAAAERIFPLLRDGYRSGQLVAEIPASEDNPDDGVSYEGWWQIATID